MDMPRVFVTRMLPAAGLERIRAACDADVWPGPLPPPREVLLDRARGCDGLLTLLTDRVDRALLEASPRLRVVSNFAVGFDNVDVAAATELGVAVGNTPGVLTDATADLAVALLLAAARRVVEGCDAARGGRWRTWEPTGFVGRDLAGRTLGIVGMGRIGLAVARRCRFGWGMDVLYADPHRNEDAEREVGGVRTDLGTLLARSDFVSVHANLSDATRGMFGADAFRRMKRTAVFVNTSRGALVDEDALHAALRDGVIFAAGLDVTDPEPPRADHPLLALPNCVVTPHVASATEDTRNAMAEIAADNLLLGLAGRALRHWVNPAVADRLRARS